jgi:transcriptional regulator with XRE-family HTH domain
MTEEEALIDRIRTIIEQKRLNSSYLAEQIGSSRSVITHILNGRNNPSWDILKKILEKFDDINTEWLLFGKEPMYKSERSIIKPEKSAIQSSLFDKPELDEPKIEIKPVEDTPLIEYRKEIEVKPVEKPIKQADIEEVMPIKPESKKIAKIMIFYSNNTFETFNPDMKPFE